MYKYFIIRFCNERNKKKNMKYDSRIVFNLIVTGSKCEKVMDFLIEKKYEHFFKMFVFIV